LSTVLVTFNVTARCSPSLGQITFGPLMVIAS
jgi:hypothetical protein